MVLSRLRSLRIPLVWDSEPQESAKPEFQLHPHYRVQMPLDAILLNTKPGLDNFITEKYADQIGAILREWCAGLLRSPADVKGIENVLASNFSGASFRTQRSRLVRSSSGIEIRQNIFTQDDVGRDDFLRGFQSTLSSFSRILTAEFQITRIEALPPFPTAEREHVLGAGGGSGDSSAKRAAFPGRVRTRVRYDLVGSGQNFHREQRVGQWELEWEAAQTSSSLAVDFRLKTWRMSDETQSRSSGPVFIDITAEAFRSNSSYSAQLLHGSDHWRTILDGACGIDIYGHNGVSVGDIDDDGFDDLYVCQPAGLPNRLYRNRGDGTFEDVTEKSGVGILDNTACALFADFDNDGQQDLIVVRTGGPMLFLNQGGGKFRHKPDAFHFAKPPQGTFTGAAVADYDRDGWLDVYFCLYLYYQGTDQYKYPSPYYAAENGPPNFLMRNNRDGSFHDATAQTGLDKNNIRYSFCCAWNDFNNDGWPDLYVVNDFGRKNLYRNNGDGTFTDIAAETGVQDVGAGMGACWLDYDNDGAQDLYVADMWTAAGERISMQDIFQKDAPEGVRALYRKHARGNSLFHNIRFRDNSNDGFQDVSESTGVEVGRWSWSSDAWDFDHDGFPDLYIANGMISGPSRDDLNSFFWRQVVANSPNEARPAHAYEQGWNALNELIRSDGTWSGYERNVFYANNRDGTFSDVSGIVGLDFLEDGRAFAFADFDHDGRLEVFLKNRNSPQLRVLKNVARDLPPSITFRLRGGKSNPDAIGASVTLETESGRQTRTLQAGSGFLSQQSKEVFFGLGAAKGLVRATIRWPSGLAQELHDLPPNHRIWVEEGAEPSRMEPFNVGQRLKSASSVDSVDARRPRSGHAPEAVSSEKATLQNTESFPTTVETWLLAPVSAPDFSLRDLTGNARTLAMLRGKPALVYFWVVDSAKCREDLELFNRLHRRWADQGLQLLTINVDNASDLARVRFVARERRLSFPILQGSDDIAAIYNILYRYLFDRHRDMPLPISFLISEAGNIVKVYQGPMSAEHVEQDFGHIPQSATGRLAKALPFPGISESQEFRRNYLNYGSVFFQRGYYDQADASFRLALVDEPSSAEALYGLGSVYLKREKIAEARESFERATTAQASYPETVANAWNNLGLLATREGRTAEAIPYFQEALKLSPDHLVALENLGNAYRQLKRWDEARTTLERAVRVSPDDPEANYSLGMVFAQIDNPDRAYEYLERALKVRPDYPEALNNLGVLYLRTQRRDEAVAIFEQCIRVAPAFDQSYLNLARVYTLEGTPDKARAVLLELLRQNPNHAQAKKMIEGLSR